MGDLFRSAGIDVLFPYLPCENAGVPFLFWLVDLQHRCLPELYPKTRPRFEESVETNGKAADRIMVNSEATRLDVARFYPELLPKTRVVRPCSVPTKEWFCADIDEVSHRYSLPGGFFLISNQFLAHKNHETVFRAIARLRDSGTRLHVVCTGRTEDYRDPAFFPVLRNWVESNGLADQIRFLGAIPRADQLAIMRRSLAVIQPSRFEGWGFAISDAKALGKPVLASDLRVNREHQARVLSYTEALDVDAWAIALKEAAENLMPGPDLGSEEAAREVSRIDTERVGREVVELFRGTLAASERNV